MRITTMLICIFTCGQLMAEPHYQKITIDPSSTYLPVPIEDYQAGAKGPNWIDLTALGFPPGSIIGLRRQGAYQLGAGGDDVGTNIAFIFDVGEPAQIGQAGYNGMLMDEAISPQTCVLEEGQDLEVPRDYLLYEEERWVLAFRVPAGATKIAFTANDCAFWDNTDPNGDLAIEFMNFEAVMDNAVMVSNTGGLVQLTLEPNYFVMPRNAARLAGFRHFNWKNQILRQQLAPEYNIEDTVIVDWDRNACLNKHPLVLEQSHCSCAEAAATGEWVTSSPLLQDPPFDPPIGGWGYQSDLEKYSTCRNTCAATSAELLSCQTCDSVGAVTTDPYCLPGADSHPWYWDIVALAKWYKETSSSLSAIGENFFLFMDNPRQPVGVTVDFRTSLVGIYPGQPCGHSHCGEVLKDIEGAIVDWTYKGTEDGGYVIPRYSYSEGAVESGLIENIEVLSFDDLTPEEKDSFGPMFQSSFEQAF